MSPELRIAGIARAMKTQRSRKHENRSHSDGRTIALPFLVILIVWSNCERMDVSTQTIDVWIRTVRNILAHLAHRTRQCANHFAGRIHAWDLHVIISCRDAASRRVVFSVCVLRSVCVWEIICSWRRSRIAAAWPTVDPCVLVCTYANMVHMCTGLSRLLSRAVILLVINNW